IGVGGRHRGRDLGPHRRRSIVVEVDHGATSGRGGVVGWWSKGSSRGAPDAACAGSSRSGRVSRSRRDGVREAPSYFFTNFSRTSMLSLALLASEEFGASSITFCHIRIASR